MSRVTVSMRHLNPAATCSMSVHKVLDSAELLGLILSFASISTCARLVSTSRCFFNQGVVYVWKNLPTAKPLILLIPSAQELELIENKRTISLPPPPTDFSRFDIYAPFVCILNTFRPGENEYWAGVGVDSSWQPLVSRARQVALLPNLKQLILNHVFETDDEPVLWVSVFISPSLVAFSTINMQGSTLFVTSSTMSIILGMLARRCPNLTSITWCLGSSNNFLDGSSFLRLFMENPVSQAWQSFQALRTLVTDVNALDSSSLSSLGQLPHLHCLVIRGILLVHPERPPERLPSSASAAILSKDSFPNLQVLHLCELHCEDVTVVWCLAPLVKELRYLKVDVQPSSNETTTAGILASGFLPALAARSPKLRCMHIDFMSRSPSEHGSVALDVEYFRSLATLPLFEVKIGRAFLFDPRAIDPMDPSIVTQIVDLWPNVTTLILPDQTVTLSHLQYFTALPNLSCLVLDLHWNIGEWPIHSAVPSTPKGMQLHTFEFSKKVTQEFLLGRVEDLAVYLESCWPNLVKVDYPTRTLNDPKIVSLDMLNFCLRTFRAIDGIQRRIAQQYGAEAVDSLTSSELVGLY